MRSWTRQTLLLTDALCESPTAKTLAVEHTMIEPFVGEKQDCAAFEATFLEIEKDKSLCVDGC